MKRKIAAIFAADIAGYSRLVAEDEEETLRRLASSGRPGMGLKAANEQDAVNGALANCAKRDSHCHIIAIGPYAVRSN